MIGLPQALVAALAASALPAGAAPAGELPFVSLGADRVATCLAAPGGDRVAVTDTSPFQVRQVRLLRASPAGDLVPEAAVPLGRMLDCPRAAVAPDGAAVAAGVVGAGADAAMAIAVREPGGGFDRPARVPVTGGAFVDDVVLAVAPGGAAVVAWTELVRGTIRVRVVRRPAGAAVGPAGTALAGPAEDVPLAVAIDPAGTATLAWSRDGTGRRDVVEVSSAAAGARFGAPQRLPAGRDAQTLALAAAPDGGMLLADGESGSVHVFGRAAGDPVFRAAGRVPRVPRGRASRCGAGLRRCGGRRLGAGRRRRPPRGPRRAARAGRRVRRAACGSPPGRRRSTTSGTLARATPSPRRSRATAA